VLPAIRYKYNTPNNMISDPNSVYKKKRYPALTFRPLAPQNKMIRNIGIRRLSKKMKK
jgi:hypothetical protein